MLRSTFNRQARELDYIDRLRRNLVDGLLFATNHADDGALAASINASSGVVLVDEDVVGAQGPKVFPDNDKAARSPVNVCWPQVTVASSMSVDHRG
jgi:LacI family transcriptional regulator